MVAYHEFFSLTQSPDSEKRGQAAHIAAYAYVHHVGPADEHAALYAALMNFLEDPSVKVRAALAYGLLHAENAPRPVMVSLLHDSAIIARAVVQYCPVLVDADLLPMVRDAELQTLLALAQRKTVSRRLAEALLSRQERAITLKVLARPEIAPGRVVLLDLARRHKDDAELRGVLLARRDLPSEARLLLVQAVTAALAQLRIVKGALAPARLARLLQNSADGAVSAIGEKEAERDDAHFAATLVETKRLNTRTLLHAVVSGHVLFFADCLAELSGCPRKKVLWLLDSGNNASLNALLHQSGFAPDMRDLFVRLIMHARAADLADDLAARHYVVTALTEGLIDDYAGDIPEALEEAFTYLCEQNAILARRAARGVMSAFAIAARTEMIEEMPARPAA